MKFKIYAQLASIPNTKFEANW